jgi:glyoxylase-like metal-dependent hydrolase (beta-lactamase superfamily II)
MKGALLLLVLALAQTAAPRPEAPAARLIAADTYLLAGAILPDRGPDGNTVLFLAPGGLVVVDTGRHPWHSDGILAFARERKQPVAAIVNTHWHLDHSSGNVRLKAAYPNAKVYTTNAIDRVLAPGGFLARNLDDARKMYDSVANEVQKDEMKIFFDTMEASKNLRPDVPVTKSAPLTIAGKQIDMRVTDKAVSDADVWIYDNATKLAVIGDLITVLPSGPRPGMGMPRIKYQPGASCCGGSATGGAAGCP